MRSDRRRAGLLAGVLIAAAAVTAGTADAAGTAVTLADTGGTKSILSAELAAASLTAQGFTVTRVSHPGAAAADAALRAGSVDAYATETATVLERVLARPRERDDAKLIATLTAQLGARGASVVAVTPSDDAPAVACTRRAVRDRKLQGVFGLPKAAPSLTYAATPEHVVRADGLASLRARFRRVVVSAGAGRFTLIQRGKVHCVLSSGADPRAAALKLVTLRDTTRRLAGTPQHGAVVVSQAYLAGAPPTFVPSLDRVAALVTTANLRTLVGQVDVDTQPVAAVAAGFLRANGVIP